VYACENKLHDTFSQGIVDTTADPAVEAAAQAAQAATVV
jgi:hypothetical protein